MHRKNKYQTVCDELSMCSLRARAAGGAKLRPARRRSCRSGWETAESWRVDSGRGEKRKLVGQEEGSVRLGAPRRRTNLC